MIEESIRRLLARHPEVLYGFTSITYSPYAERYRSALVLAIPYTKQLTLQSYKEAVFEEGIQGAHRKLETILAELRELLDGSQVSYWIPSMAQSSEKELIAPFSFKFAAVHAGLGWIGKNDVVVTERYGPRVRLCAVLIDSPFRYGEPIKESRCPAGCRKCVDACPYKALHNVTWDIRKLRNEIIDYQLCNQKRSLFIEEHGRKNACGLCLAACPFGM